MHLLFLAQLLWVEGFILFVSTKEALRQIEFLPESVREAELPMLSSPGFPWLMKMLRICSVFFCWLQMWRFMS